MIVPDNKIAVIPTIEDPSLGPFDLKELDSFLVSLRNIKKREWFTSNFYRCLPLTIGNMQGFAFKSPFEFDVLWNGGESPNDIFFNFYDDQEKFRNRTHVSLKSHFGTGIMTFSLPVILKTPPGVNLMTIAPPNFPLPGISPMTGVVETDNLRYTFTVNIKIDIANQWINIKADYPLAGIIPIPRYFCDEFELIDASKIFYKEEILEEITVARENSIVRNFYVNKKINNGIDRCYYSGTDIRGNKFSDHQLPNQKPKKIGGTQ